MWDIWQVLSSSPDDPGLPALEQHLAEAVLPLLGHGGLQLQVFGDGLRLQYRGGGLRDPAPGLRRQLQAARVQLICCGRNMDAAGLRATVRLLVDLSQGAAHPLLDQQIEVFERDIRGLVLRLGEDFRDSCWNLPPRHGQPYPRDPRQMEFDLSSLSPLEHPEDTELKLLLEDELDCSLAHHVAQLLSRDLAEVDAQDPYRGAALRCLQSLILKLVETRDLRSLNLILPELHKRLGLSPEAWRELHHSWTEAIDLAWLQDCVADVEQDLQLCRLFTDLPEALRPEFASAPVLDDLPHLRSQLESS